MDANWKRIAKDYLFELSLKDKNGRQLTLLQSWKKIVAVILHDTNTMVKTKKHYAYDVTISLEKLAKQQKLKLIVLSESTFYTLLTDKIHEDAFFMNCEKDIEFCEGYDEQYEPSEDEDDEEYPWEDDEDDDSE